MVGWVIKTQHGLITEESNYINNKIFGFYVRKRRNGKDLLKCGVYINSDRYGIFEYYTLDGPIDDFSGYFYGGKRV
jgi:hypothetical protein